jgi:hypothetical protein
MLIARPRQGGLEEPDIAHARLAAVLRQLLIVDREDDLAIDPGGLGHWSV